MTLNLKFVNPINDKDEELIVKYPIVDASYYKYLKPFYNDNDICKILDDLLEVLDCTIVTKIGRVCTTSAFIYEDRLSSYYYYLSHITNQLLYNQYIDKLINRHVDNIVFESTYIPVGTVPVKVKHKRNKKAPKGFVRHVSKDLITGEDIYFYNNDRTGEEIRSTNPNLLDTLNKPKKKRVGVPMSAMTWNFNIAKTDDKNK